MDLSGQVFLDGFEADPSSIVVRREIAYVEQEVSLLPTTTTREAIMFSARLRLGRHKSHQELQDVTNEILEELGLNGCADTMVGGGLIRGGLSGGEKKRCQCGVELVTSPGIVILDEPSKFRCLVWYMSSNTERAIGLFVYLFSGRCFETISEDIL
mmetsp:Transcript_59848/g.146993  ORF Transcript_59848/g.146993 Transcript_59848/m.146993 type:complete len:156 (-) Transcript_59848:89-556(-)